MPTEPDKTARLFENKLAGSSQERLAWSHKACRLAAQRASSTIFPGIKLIPEPARSGLLALYAWKRRVDDAADVDGLVEARRVDVQRLRKMTADAFQGHAAPNSDDFWQALTECVAAFAIPEAWLVAVLDGAEHELNQGEVQSEEELELACYRSASTLMMALVRVVGVADGVDEADALELAKRRGLAMQLTDHLRDFAGDYDSVPRRIAFPAQAFHAAGLKPNAMRVWMPAEACERFALHWIGLAEEVFESSDGLEALIDPAARNGLRLMTRLSRETLGQLRKEPSRMVRGGKVRAGSGLRSRLGVLSRLGWA